MKGAVRNGIVCALVSGAEISFRALDLANSALSSNFIGRKIQGAFLDILFGAEEHFEYVSTTTP